MSSSKYDKLNKKHQEISTSLSSVLKTSNQHSKYNALQQDIYQKTFDGVAYAIVATDLYGVIQVFNKGAQKLLGYSSQEVIGIHTPNLFHDPEEIKRKAIELSRELGITILPGFEVFIAKAKEGIVDESEWNFIAKNGERYPILLSVTCTRDKEGLINGYLGISFDIAEKLFIKRALVEEKRYRLLFESSSDAIFLMLENRFIDCNPATLKMFNCTREQILGETPVKFSPKFQLDGRESSEKAKKMILEAFLGTPQTFEWLHQRLDGSGFDAEVRLNSILIAGQVHLLATVRDISKRKHAEKTMEIYRKQAVLQNSSLKLVNEFASKIKSEQKPEKIAENSVQILASITKGDLVSVYFFDEKEQSINLIISSNSQRNRINKTISLSGSLSGVAIRKNRIQICEDVATSKHLNSDVAKILMDIGICSLAIAPLYYQGKIYGTLNVSYKHHHSFSEMEKETIVVVANTLAQALSNSNKIQEFEYLAHHDSLTKLPNRLSYHQVFLNKIKSKKFCGALLLFDLNGFKEVNDTLGHYVGDLLLKQIGSRLTRLYSERKVMICRLGGDEFILLFDHIVDLNKITIEAESLLSNLKAPFEVDSTKLEIDASIGIALYPKDGEDSHEMLRSADVAMYDAKANRKGIAIYDVNKDKNSIARLSLMTELGNAIDCNELILHYQPKIVAKTGEVEGFESLVRWQHPKHGLLYPDSFIPLAEMSEVIHPLTEKVFLLALEQQKYWFNLGKKYSVAINLSVRNLSTDRFVKFLQRYVKKNKIETNLVEFEVTETAIMQDVEMATNLLQKISELGFKISIDDFGTGYSSLSHLRRMPINALKIDREFVNELHQNEQDSIIISSIIGLAHNLKLTVIAEGVESDLHRELLSNLGCDQLQGYGICRPNNWQEIQAWLNLEK